MTAEAPRLVAGHVTGTEGGLAGGRRGRELDVSAEAGVVLVVVFLDDERMVRELGLKMETIGRAAGIKRTDQRRPAGAVGIDGPDTPEDVAADALGFERAEHDAAIGEHDGMERAAEVEMADFLDVRAAAGVGVIHHEELQGDGGVAFGGTEAVAIAREDEASAGERVRSHVEDAVVEVRAAGLGRAEVVGPVGRASVGREGLVGEADDAAGFDVDFENVRAAAGRGPLVGLLQIVEMREINPLTIEGDYRVRDGTFATGDEEFLTAVRMKQHEVRARLHGDGRGEVGVEAFVKLIARARGADIDEVVVRAHRFVGGDMGDGEAEVLAKERFGYGGEDAESSKE